MLFIEGPLHKIKVKFVTNRTLRQQAGDIQRDEDVMGLYAYEENTIWVRKDLPNEEKLHVLLHELGHAIEKQLKYAEDEEGRVHIIATWIAKFAKITSVDQILTEDPK